MGGNKVVGAHHGDHGPHSSERNPKFAGYSHQNSTKIDLKVS